MSTQLRHFRCKRIRTHSNKTQFLVMKLNPKGSRVQKPVLQKQPSDIMVFGDYNGDSITFLNGKVGGRPSTVTQDVLQ